MINIDGSYGEGGGQILRNTISLSTLTGRSVKINNIRANRPKPGIRPQHYIAIKSLEEICNAKTRGLKIDSLELEFHPGKIKPGKYNFDITTAGSITLVFQAIILASCKIKEQIQVKIVGGSDVKWSPSWDYFEYVFLGNLKKMGLKVNSEVIKRGYYPKGGGEAVITIYPHENIQPLNIDEKREYETVKGIINIANLPDHIPHRMKNTVVKNLMKNNLRTTIQTKEYTSISPGVGITLWNKNNNSIIGTSAIGEKGISSEEIGKKVSEHILKEINSNATLDIYGLDQILPYMTLATDNGVSKCIVSKISNHASTNMWLLKQFFDIDFQANQTDDNIVITVKK